MRANYEGKKSQWLWSKNYCGQIFQVKCYSGQKKQSRQVNYCGQKVVVGKLLQSKGYSKGYFILSNSHYKHIIAVKILG